MAEAREWLVQLMGQAETQRLLIERPQAILDNAEPASVHQPHGLVANDNGELPEPRGKPWFKRFF